MRLGSRRATYDAALSTWRPCTVPDFAAALREVRHVLKPGGTSRVGALASIFEAFHIENRETCTLEQVPPFVFV